MLGTKETVLLGAPEAEAELQTGVVLLCAGEELEDHGGTGAVVIDTRAGLDTVQMGAHDDDGIGVAALGLGDNVPGLAVLNGLLLLEEDVDLLASLETGLPGQSVGAEDEAGRAVGNRVRGREGASGGLGLNVVVDNNGRGTGSDGSLDTASEGGLVRAPALALASHPTMYNTRLIQHSPEPLDQHNLSVHIVAGISAGVAAGQTSRAQGQRRRDAGIVGARGVGQAKHVDGLLSLLAQLNLVDNGEESLELLLAHVNGALEAVGTLEDVVGAGAEAGKTKGTVAAVAVRNALQRLQVLHQLDLLDVVDQAVGRDHHGGDGAMEGEEERGEVEEPHV